MRAPAAGGGRPARRKSAGCIVRSRPAVLSMSLLHCLAATVRMVIPTAIPPVVMMQSDEPLRLDRLQRDILVPQLESFLSAAGDDSARSAYVELREALDRLEV